MVMVATATVAIGCGGDAGRQRSRSAVTSLKETRAEAAMGTADVDQALASVAALENASGDLQQPFRKFKAEAADVEARATEMAARATDMRTRAAEYRTAWTAERAQLTTPELREAAEQRAQQVGERFTRIEAKYREAQNVYQPFLIQLRDLQTYLSNDLTTNGIRAAKQEGAFERVREEGQTVKTELNELVAELDQATTALSPTVTTRPTTMPAK